MLSLEELESSCFSTKKGDIKVDSDDLKKILNYLSFCQNLIGNMLNELTEDEKQTFLKGIRRYEYFKNKYIVLGDLRSQQVMWFQNLKEIDRKINMNEINGTKEEIEELRRNVFSMYLEKKTEREKLQKEIDNFNF